LSKVVAYVFHTVGLSELSEEFPEIDQQSAGLLLISIRSR